MGAFQDRVAWAYNRNFNVAPEQLRPTLFIAKSQLNTSSARPANNQLRYDGILHKPFLFRNNIAQQEIDWSCWQTVLPDTLNSVSRPRPWSNVHNKNVILDMRAIS